MKIALGLLLIFVFFTVMFNYGPWPDGVIAQRNAFNFEATYLLEKFREEQLEYFETHQEYRDDLLSREPYSTAKNFKLGYAAESTVVAEHCPECVKTNKTFKIGAAGKFKGADVLWSIDHLGNLSNPKPLPE